MKKIIFLSLAVLSLLLFGCSEDNNPGEVASTGKLVIRSTPPGAQIYLEGVNTGNITPSTIENLEPGNYDGFLLLQYYDTAFFAARVYNNTTTTVDTILTDGLPFVEFTFDFLTAFSDDSVRFYFTINQDVTIDSIIVQRPVDMAGTYEIEKYFFNGELFEYKTISGSLIKYYLPSSGGYYPAIENRNYNFNMFGHKAYGAKVEFRSNYSVTL